MCAERTDLSFEITITVVNTTQVAKFDGVIIESTGMADPAPVAQTFFLDEEIQQIFSTFSSQRDFHIGEIVLSCLTKI